VEDNVINMPNASNAYVFEAAEGGYKIKMGNGRYLFQAESYNNFNSTTDAGKADVWDVTFDEEGFATIKNITVANKWMQWTSYGNAGAYSSAQDGAVLPKLYKDAKPASDEILIVPETFSVIAEATTASIPVQSNKTWKVRCHDEWIKSFTTEGEGDGSIELTFDANSSVEEAKTATIQIIGETVNYNITFVQNKVATTIAEVVAMLTSTDKNNQSAYSVDLTGGDAVVSYVNGSNAFIEDKTGAILLYKSGHGLTAGKKVSGKISGTGYIYNGLPELTSFDGAELSDGGTIPCTEMTLPDLIKNYKSNFSRRVLIKGVTVTDAINGSDRDGKIEAGGKNVAVRAQSSSLNMPTGVCDIICFPSIFKTTYQVSLFDNAHCTYSSINSTLSVNDLSVNVGGDVDVTLSTNNTEGAVTYSVDNTSIAVVDNNGRVTGVAEGEAVLTVKIAAAGIYSAVEATAKITVVAGEAPKTPGFYKVTSAPSEWTGKYLIVFGSNAHASLASGAKDLTSTVAITIADNAVEPTSEVNAAAVTVAKNGDKYSVMLPDGKYFGMQHNGCLLCDSPFDIDFEYTANGVKISGYVESKSATYYLYANTNGGPYYRCYVDKTGSSGYTLPTLYKFVAE
ncbi:MAG: Ig-like domain-containing protein, partial [Candidatus Cryptobacteroides sp.]